MDEKMIELSKRVDNLAESLLMAVNALTALRTEITSGKTAEVNSYVAPVQQELPLVPKAAPKGNYLSPVEFDVPLSKISVAIKSPRITDMLLKNYAFKTMPIGGSFTITVKGISELRRTQYAVAGISKKLHKKFRTRVVSQSPEVSVIRVWRTPLK